MTTLAPGTPLFALAELADPGARGLLLGEGAARLDLFVVRKGDALRGYINRCPHAGTPLETFPDRFFDITGSLIVCSTHGARFRPLDGYCVAGPCKGQALTPFPIAVLDGIVVVGRPA